MLMNLYILKLTGEKFHRFDYGREENMKRYGSPGPAEYDLSLVTAPVYLISGDADPIAPPEVLYNQLKQSNLFLLLLTVQNFTIGRRLVSGQIR